MGRQRQSNQDQQRQAQRGQTRADAETLNSTPGNEETTGSKPSSKSTGSNSGLSAEKPGQGAGELQNTDAISRPDNSTNSSNEPGDKDQLTDSTAVSEETVDQYSNNYTVKRLLSKNNNNIVIDKFILGEYSDAPADILTFIYRIESNKQNFLDSNKIESIKAYKNSINNNLYAKLENKASMFFADPKISKTFIKNCFENFNKFDDTSLKIKNGIIEKTDKIKENSFESFLKLYIHDSSSNLTSLFNAITNDFYTDNKILHNSSSLLSRDSFKLFTSNSTASELNYLSVDTLNKHNLIFLDTTDQRHEFVKEIRSTSNDIVIQNIVNLVRSLYTVSPNCLIGNYVIEENRIYTDFNRHSLKCLKSESFDVELFNNIDVNNSNINIDYFLNHDSYSVMYRNNNDSRVIEYDNSILGKDTYNYMPETLYDYVNSTMFTKFKQNYNLPNREAFISDLNAALYNGNFFNFNISSYNIDFSASAGDNVLKLLKDKASAHSNVNPHDFEEEDYFVANYVKKGSIENETIYLNNDSLTNYNRITGRNVRTGNITASDSLLLDVSSLYSLENMRLKLSIDSFVKKHKFNNLKNKNVSLNFAIQTIEKIKNSRNETCMLSYCKNDTKDISVIDEESDIYDMMFTSGDDLEVYSHIDLISNHKIDNVNFFGLDKMKKNNVIQNNKNEGIKSNFKNMFSNYYPRNSLFSSSNLFYRFLNALELEAQKVSDSKYEEISLTQALYFNYFKENKNKKLKVKKLISKRLLKKAMQLDSKSSYSFRHSNELSSFLYDFDTIVKDDYDNTNKSSIRSYLNDILNSSENLKTLKNTVFSNNNISSLKDKTLYKRVSNISIIDNFTVTKQVANMNIRGRATTKVLETTTAIASIINYNVLPNYSFLFAFASIGDFNEDSKVEFDIQTKNTIFEEKIINENEDEDEDEISIYHITIEDTAFDIQTSKNIKNKIIPKVNRKALLESSNSSNENYPSIIIEDLFDIACNTEGFAFNSLLKVIQDMLRMSSKKYEDSSFSNEEDLESFISGNEEFVDEVMSVIDMFCNIYFIYFFRLQRSQALNIFRWQQPDIELPQRYNDASEGASDFPTNGIISKHSEVYTTFNKVISGGAPIAVVNSDNALDLIRDISKLCRTFTSTPEAFLGSSINLESDSVFSTSVTEELYNIMQSLYQSDVAQATTFDILNGYINHQTKLLASERNEITSSSIFNNLTDLNEAVVEDIEENFYDIFYINKLSNVIFESYLNNVINKNTLTSNINSTNTAFLNNIDYFSDINKKNQELIEATGSQILSSPEDVIKQETFFYKTDDYLNSNFYSFALKKSSLQSLNHDSIIKLKVTIVDNFNLNRYYIPKIYLFSPSIANISYLTQSHLSFLSINMPVNDIIGVYNPDRDIHTRLELMRLTELINFEDNYFKSIIHTKLKSKYTEITESDAVSLYKHLLYCHTSSNEVGRISKEVYDINSIDKQSNSISAENIELIDSLGEKQFFDIFDSKKNDLLGFSSSGYNNIESKTCYYDFLKSIDDISKTRSIENFVNNKYYDIYNIAISPESFYWTELNGNGNNIANVEDHTLNDFQSTIHKIVGVSLSQVDARYKKYIHAAERASDHNLKMDNFNLVFDIEILR
jgi:hypothetical protein